MIIIDSSSFHFISKCVAEAGTDRAKESWQTRVAGNLRSVAWLVFFFSSRRRHTRFDCDWSSDVCSSDLSVGINIPEEGGGFTWSRKFGYPTVGFVAGCAYLGKGIVSSVVISLAFATYTAQIGRAHV